MNETITISRREYDHLKAYETILIMILDSKGALGYVSSDVINAAERLLEVERA